MHSAFPRSGEEDILTIVQKNLDNRPNCTYTQESSVIPADNVGASEHIEEDMYERI